MYRIRLMLALGLCPLLSGCGTDPAVCTASWAMVAATVVDGAGQVLGREHHGYRAPDGSRAGRDKQRSDW